MTKKIEISSNKFIWLMSLYLGYVLNILFLKKVFLNFSISSFYELLSFVLLLVLVSLPIVALLNLILFKYTFKPLGCTILIVSAISNWMMLDTGVVIDADIIRDVFETNTREALDFVSFSSVIYVLIFGIIPSIFICLWVRIKNQSFKKELIKRSLNIVGILSIVALYFLCFSKVIIPFGRNTPSCRSAYNTLNYVVNTVKYIKIRLSGPRTFLVLDDSPREDFFNKSSVHVSLVVIGETARSKNFSLYNYDRETNPKLKTIKNLLVLKDPEACGTSTAISVPCIFSSKTRDDFKVDDARWEENVLDIIQKAGYKVYWYENDNGCKKVCNRIKTYDVVEIGNKDYCLDDYCYDEALIPHVSEALQNIKNENTVIVLHTIGSHGPSYYKRYPDSFSRAFNPTCNTSEISKCSTQELVNTYDNTIVYTDFIIARIIEELKKYKNYESSLIYLSDHGESLSENGLYLHGMPYSLAPKEQKSIPFLIWFSDKFLKDSFIDFECLKRDDKSVSHDNFFHTLLGITQIDSKLYNKDLDLLSNCRLKQKPFMSRNPN